MKERPILFSSSMVRALLDGSKTQTRRPVKFPGPKHLRPNFSEAWTDGSPRCQYLHVPYQHIEDEPDSTSMRVHSPYGHPGDRLWVRESFWGCDLEGYGDVPCVVYDDEWLGKEYRPAVARPWARKFGRIPSIHMPRNCSRILLEITDVRVERLQDISKADAIAEGIGYFCGFYRDYLDPANTFKSPIDSYRSLWESINGPGSWESNPWCWAIAFQRIAP